MDLSSMPPQEVKPHQYLRRTDKALAELVARQVLSNPRVAESVRLVLTQGFSGDKASKPRQPELDTVGHVLASLRAMGVELVMPKQLDVSPLRA